MRAPILLALAVVCAACSSSESSSGGGAGAIPSSLGAYCKGTLKVSAEYMTPSGPSAWIGMGATVPAGTTVLMSESFDKWAAYTFLADGSPAKIEADFSKGLVAGVDFDSTCVDKGKDRANQRTVLLRASTFFADASLGGTACTLPAGTVLTNYMFSSSGSGAASVGSAEIKSTCGLDKAYSKDVLYATLIVP